MLIKRVMPILMLIFLAIPTAWANNFDHSGWNKLLVSHVSPINGNKATVVDYMGMKKDRELLKQYLDALSSISMAEFDQWSKQEQLAFLINAYNAWTVELILSKWPDLKSIKDIGGLFSSPWSKELAYLLGKMRTLDDIEHGLIRGSGRYNEPRIHFAVNCASISCPALRAEAYEGNKIERQLNEQTVLFLSDRSRNRIDKNSLMLSSIFKWYREDFEKGWQGFNRLEDFLLVYSSSLGLSDAIINQLKSGNADIKFLNYDWRLNQK